jgi:hypothetical protein
MSLDQLKITKVSLNKTGFLEGEDLVVLCPLELPEAIGSSDDLRLELVAFKVVSKRLQANSTVFESLLQDATPGQMYEGLPIIQVTENSHIMGHLLSFEYNVASPNDRFLLTPQDRYPPTSKMDIWEACNKYMMLSYLCHAVMCMKYVGPAAAEAQPDFA